MKSDCLKQCKQCREAGSDEEVEGLGHVLQHRPSILEHLCYVKMELARKDAGEEST